uniref:Uncharacterized protein n=1 Tax=Physcomitrium patens TaxID=3218 RepID=A0A2K1KCK7_PHYPA|nr:hypothetical protein PHYPA_010703 [Physcomitrium patens]
MQQESDRAIPSRFSYGRCTGVHGLHVVRRSFGRRIHITAAWDAGREPVEIVVFPESISKNLIVDYKTCRGMLFHPHVLLQNVILNIHDYCC